MRRLHLLQLDAVPVVTRTQYLPLFSRCGVYPQPLHDDLAYRRDEWFEAFIHEASIIPVEDEPLTRVFRDRARDGHTWKGLVEFAQAERAYVADVLAEIVERGPLRSGELSNPRPREGEWWGSRSLGSVALDWLFRSGTLGIRRNDNFEKFFDLLDRIVPEDVRAAPTPSHDDAWRELMRRAAAAYGIASAADLVDYFRLPKRESKALIPSLVEDGSLIPCRVAAVDLDLFMTPDVVVPRSVTTAALVSPFDPLVWHRPRASWLFDFEYRIEIYVPRAKRQYGYYVLPFLHNEQISARCDLKTDRTESVLRVLGAWPEPHCADGLAPALADELVRLAEFVGVERVQVEGSQQLAADVAAVLDRC